MRAYAVFAGGGVKGSALAGCLAAAQDQGVEFVGYGGTSAGSIVAMLAAVGYTGDEVREIIVDKDFCELLDDDGELLQATKKSLEQAAHRFESGSKLLGACGAIGLVKRLWTSLGLYEGARLAEFLCELMGRKIDPARPATDFAALTFRQFHDLGGLPLRIVASDITNRRAVVFPRDLNGAEFPVVSAVRASAGFPLVFRPLECEGRQLVDGGLASNLPSFLFADESRDTRLLTLAFDLTSAQAAERTPLDLLRIGQGMLNTALEASDVLLRDVAEAVVHIPIELPPGINTLDFDIQRPQRQSLFDAGYRQTAAFLSRFAPLRNAQRPGLELQSRLMAQFGDPKLYQPVLEAVARDMEELTDAEDVRAQIMLITGRRLDDGRSTRMVVYQAGMDDDDDRDLEIADDAGCTGQAWARRVPAVADLAAAAADPSPWKMSLEEHRRVPPERKSIISVPIPGRSGSLGGPANSGPPPVGTLSVDSTTLLADTSWVDESQHRIHADVVSILTGWAYVIARLLP